MKLFVSLFCGIALLCVAGEPPMEKLVLFGGDSAKSWSAAEATMTPSADHVKTSGASLHWHITVDYYAGESKYPIGWPRVSHSFAESARDWSAWDFVHVWIYTETSRDKLPREPVGLAISAPDKHSSYYRPLSELKKGEWVEIKVPVSQIPRPSDVRSIQFHIAEANYKHGDKLDLYMDDLALLRYAEPVLLDFAAENAVMFADARALPVRFQLAGIKPGASAGVTCELVRDGKVAAHVVWTAQRGPQRFAFDLGRQKLAPGNYELVACVAGGTQPATARVRVVESPWR